MSSSNVKTPASTSEPVLTALVLAVGAGPHLAEGPKGEASFAAQLTDLLQEKPLPSDELDHLYRYRHGVGLSQALELVGFGGSFQDFVAAQKGRLCISPEGAVETMEKMGEDEAMEVHTSADSESTADPGDVTFDSADYSNIDPVVFDNGDPVAWHSLSGRLASALGELCEQDDEEAPDVEAWRTVGQRVLAAMVDVEDDEEEDLPSGLKLPGWHSVGLRLVNRMSDDEI